MGVGRYLRRSGRPVRIHLLEPANSPMLRTGYLVERHRIRCISDEFVAAILDLAESDDVIDVWDGDAILMAQTLCRSFGLPVGISSGTNGPSANQPGLREKQQNVSRGQGNLYGREGNG